MTLNNRNSENTDGLIDLFPNPHYFQVHFQYIHDNTRRLQDELTHLTETATHLEEKLGQLLALLSDPSDPVR
jgi:hypothetical protein